MLRIMRRKTWTQYTPNLEPLFPTEYMERTFGPTIPETENYFLGIIQGILVTINPEEHDHPTLADYSTIAAKLCHNIQTKKINNPNELMNWICWQTNTNPENKKTILLVGIMTETFNF